MKRSALLLLIILVALLLTGCAGGSSAASASAPVPSGEKSLKDEAHISIDFRAWARERIWANFIVLGAGFAAIAALVCLVQNKKSFWKWLLILFLVTSWFLLTMATSNAIGNGWHEGLTNEFVQSCSPPCDLTPFSKTLLDWVIRVVLALLWFTHGVAVVWFFLLPAPVLIENLILGPRFAASAVGTWFGFAFSRWVTPQLIYHLMQDVCKEVVQPEGLVERAEAAVASSLDLIDAVNIKLMFIWGGSLVVMLAFFMIFFGFLGFLVAPYVGEAVVKAGRGVRDLQREAERLRERETETQRREENRQLRREEVAARQLDRQEVEGRIQKVERRLEARAAGQEEPRRPELPKGWQERGGMVYPPGTAPTSVAQAGVTDRLVPRVWQCQDCERAFWSSAPKGGSVDCFGCHHQVPWSRSYPDEKTWARQQAGSKSPPRVGVAAQKLDDAGAAAETAGGLTILAGQPEVGLPLIAGGRVARRVAQRTTPDQDPKVAEDQAAAERALAGFDEEVSV